MSSLLTKFVAATFSAGVLLGAGGFTATAANAYGIVPCPSGYACLYPNPPTAGDPTEYYHYGVYKLSDVTGDHEFINDQTGGAKAYLCTGNDGNGSCQLVTVGNPVVVNFNPINSIYLES